MNDMQPPPAGQLDLISDEGWVIGWAWYPGAPERRVDVEILADDVVVGTMTAGLHREDVAAAGFGDGAYGFSVALPHHVLSSPRPSIISLRDRVSGLSLAKPVVFSQPALREASAQLDALNQDVRLLSASLARLQTKEAADGHATAALFRTVADFFSQLAEVTLAGASPRTLRTLREAVTETTNTYLPLDFSPAETPEISICFLAQAGMEAMYATLAALQPGFAAAKAELLILDPDDSADAPLLPLLAGNARYLRRPAALAPATWLNNLAQAAHGTLLYFITEPVAPVPSSLPSLASSFATAQAGILTPRVMATDGIVEHAGASFTDGLLRPCAAQTADDLAAAVDVAAPQSFVVKREIWQALDGFDTRFETLTAAVAAFCLHAASYGLQTIYQPQFTASYVANTAPLPDDPAKASADSTKLRDFHLSLARG
ncbi:hypothetical protein [Acidocella sp.]|uniref:hypothetical protein n=1 Tax=Acidocella sp. TaxID=50710 RepID=UPI002601A0E1|nr:hypothetical protein [Acidocella sp.]